MIVWGGVWGFDSPKDGGRYDPATDSWRSTQQANAPLARADHTAVWSDTEMIIWGGFEPDDSVFQNTGGRYDPISDSWLSTTTYNTPHALQPRPSVDRKRNDRLGRSGSISDYRRPLRSCYQYLATDFNRDAPSGRERPVTAWTGKEMLVWDGFADTGRRAL